jgi:putative proteasome-type protease
MTYCVAMSLDEGMLFASDSRTNAGVDHVSTFCKMHTFEVPGDRYIVMLSSGNLATSQYVVNTIRRMAALEEGAHVNKVSSMFDVAEMVGLELKAAISRAKEGLTASNDVDFSCNILLGGQIKGEAPRLFLVYPQGNFIEATNETSYFQIGESKYGKPIIDRVIKPDTPLREALKSALVSFDSTMKSNLSVGLPIDVLILHPDQFAPALRYRITENDAYFASIRASWGQGLRKVFQELPNPQWFESGTQ